MGQNAPKAPDIKTEFIELAKAIARDHAKADHDRERAGREPEACDAGRLANSGKVETHPVLQTAREDED